ncbi:replication fork protection component Swi3-domain-containing protein [Ephemerocybe angulata]|uniref:Chromosome segregation in meiosis protein n=1 Tax=Ephemerocybe angulata TaxID=980116 RepID=A0A8H6IHW8_9AGAR|nr:replication fork protection component Swi3-domain-containing protein [Tulosesus angulatus]
MSAALDSLWDDPVVEDVPKRHKTPLADSDAEDSPRPSKRPRQTLFLPGSDDEDSDVEKVSRRTTQAPVEKDIDIDAIFEGIDDDDDDINFKPMEAVNADDMERQMQAKRRAGRPSLTPHQIMSSSSPTRGEPGEGRKGGKGDKDDDEKKPRRRPVLLNEALLLGPTGFPELIKNVKDFKVKGKGHEASDLNRLLGIYQFWTHGLYPKTQFRDTVTRVEKLCHTKRMQVALSVWKDEANGVPHQPESEDEDMEGEPARTDGEPSRSEQRQSSVGASSRNSSPPPPPPTSRPASSASEYDDIFDEDFEALLQAEAASSAQSTAISSSTSKSSAATTAPTDDDDSFWADMAEMDQDPVPSKPPPQKDVPMDEDQEMWDLIDEAEKAAPAKQAHDEVPQPSPPRPPPEPQYADPTEWDDMYV